MHGAESWQINEHLGVVLVLVPIADLSISTIEISCHGKAASADLREIRLEVPDDLVEQVMKSSVELVRHTSPTLHKPASQQQAGHCDIRSSKAHDNLSELPESSARERGCRLARWQVVAANASGWS